LGSPRQKGIELSRTGAGKGVGKLIAVLLYTLDYPPDIEKSFREDNKRFGDELPDPIKNKPLLKPGLALYLNAWYELDGERDRTSYQRIKRSDVFEYAHDYDFTFMQTLDLWFYVRKMDNEFFEWYKKKFPPPKKGKGRNG
tara:strand:- start:105 stop:527 length:423 start_codon:yes stop_codon:yes gene_type:complete